MKHQKHTRKFKGIWIEAEMWLTKDLTITEKVLLAEIDSLDPCFASNDYLGVFLDRTPKYVSDLISKLNKRGFIERELYFKPNSKEIDYRILKVLTPPVIKGDPLPIEKETPPDESGHPLPMNPEDITKTYNKVDNTIIEKEEKRKIPLGQQENYSAILKEEMETGKKEKFIAAVDCVDLPWDEETKKEFIGYYLGQNFNEGGFVYEGFKVFNIKAKGFAWINNNRAKNTLNKVDSKPKLIRFPVIKPTTLAVKQVATNE